MRVLCTGGRGWLGSHLCPTLVGRGHEVVALGLEDGDLIDRETAQELIGSASTDLVVHLAALPGRIFGEIEPARTIESNATMTVHVAQACASIGARLCYVSTSEVYGDGHPSTGSYAPKNLYGMTKLLGEQVARLYCPDDLLVIRPSMPYGPGMATGYGRAALPTMIDRLMRGEPYTVHRGTYRSWCYITDVVRGMADVIERGNGTYDVGRDDNLFAMEDLAYLVCSILSADPDLVVDGYPDASNTKIKNIPVDRLRDLGWAPVVSIKEGVEAVARALRA